MGELLGFDALPLLPEHRWLDWRLNEVLRPLLFAILAELEGAPDSFVEVIPAAARLWNPSIAETTIRQAVISCVAHPQRQFRLEETVSEWLSHQPFSLQQFIEVVERLRHSNVNFAVGAIGGLTENFQVPSAGHRVPAFLGNRLRLMKSCVF